MLVRASKTLLFLFCILALVCVTDVFAQNRSGTYNRKDKLGSGQLVITEVKRGQSSYIKFKLNVGRTGKTFAEYCVGEFKDKARWQSENIAEYNADFIERDSDGELVGCRLTFVFFSNSVIVRETDCNDYHGVMCSFEGKYSRPPKVTKRKSK